MSILDDAPKIGFNMKLKSDGLNKLIRYLVKFKRFPNKQPQRKYRQKIRDCLRIVLINLVDAVEYVRYSRNDHAPQYQPKKYSPRNIGRVVDFLEEAGLVENRPGGYFADNPGFSRWSRMRPTNKLKNLFVKYKINQGDIRIEKKKNLIILRDDEKNSIRCPETPFTLSARETLYNINQSLSDHHIVDDKGRYIHRKIMHRVFNVDTEHGGRFYGSEWQNMSGDDRLKLTIDNLPVVELDYNALHPAMLYAMEGMRLEGDPYLLDGYSPEVRDFLKIVMLVLINTGDKSKAKKAIQRIINFGQLILPDEVKSLDDILNGYMDKLRPIAHLFCGDIGLKLQRSDSDICEDVLMHFCKKDIPVLPVHDSFIVQKNHEKMLNEVMREVFFDKYNVRCNVSKKTAKRHASRQLEKNSNLYETLSNKD